MTPSSIKFLSLLTLITACSSEAKFSGATGIESEKNQQSQEALPEQNPIPLEPQVAASPDVEAVPAVENVEPTVLPQEDVIKEATTVEKSKDFAIKKVNLPIDMVWVIDNSTSMSEEIAQVRDNFAGFMGHVSQRTDLNVTLITATNPPTGKYHGLALDAKYLAQGHHQIDLQVNSYNAVSMAAAASCPVSETALTTKAASTICGKSILTLPKVGLDDGLESENIVAARGLLLDRYREGSKKIFIFVSDDNAKSGLDPKDFVSAIKTDASSTHVFSFSGEKANCKTVYGDGTAYKSLAAQTGGQVFKICEKDWSANFALLAESVVKLAGASYDLDDSAGVTIKKVLLDGVELSPGSYAIKGNGVTLIDKSLSADGVKLTVIYDYTSVK